MAIFATSYVTLPFVAIQANSLHWVCLGELPDIYNTTLWNCMRDTLNHIADGVRVGHS